MSALESIHSFYPAQILYRNLAEEVKETDIDSVAVSIRRVDSLFYHFGWAAAETLLLSPYLRMMPIVLQHNCITVLYYSHYKFYFCYLVCLFFYPSELMNQ